MSLQDRMFHFLSNIMCFNDLPAKMEGFNLGEKCSITQFQFMTLTEAKSTQESKQLGAADTAKSKELLSSSQLAFSSLTLPRTPF